MNRTNICKNIVQSIKDYITDQVKLEPHRMEKHFVRRRKLSLLQVIIYLFFSSKASMFQNLSQIREELGTLSFPDVSKQALSKARQFINPSLFKELYYLSVDLFYSQISSRKLWQGYHLFAVDGSRIELPNSKSTFDFFGEMSERYKDSNAVLYEICNEPNGNVTWNDNVKPYAETVIPVIRANTNAIILVGSPTWSQDLHEAAKNPINAENIMYTCHFYAGTHTDWLRQRIADCGLPVFVSEWGTSAADGNGGVYLDEAQRWIDFMNERGISWANWSLCDKNESSAALVNGANVNDGISEDELTESGKFVFKNF